MQYTEKWFSEMMATRSKADLASDDGGREETKKKKKKKKSKENMMRGTLSIARREGLRSQATQ